jgi:hypothetical protein
MIIDAGEHYSELSGAFPPAKAPRARPRRRWPPHRPASLNVRIAIHRRQGLQDLDDRAEDETAQKARAGDSVRGKIAGRQFARP